jgi:proline dehydrogenase|tara:strand:- start:10485 stop:11087 length:603 start_codon:yes stop_codon:yes gene_type:complete
MNQQQGGLNAFNDTFKEFISELSKTFPTYPVIKELEESIDKELEKDKRKYLTVFMKLANEHNSIIHTQDEKALLEMDDEKLPLVEYINIKELLESKYATENNKKAIWQYLKSLLMFGTTVSLIPDDMMNTLDGLASQMANKIESGEIDPKLIIQNAQNLLMNNPMFQNNDLQNLFSGLVPPGAQQQQNNSKKGKKKKSKK